MATALGTQLWFKMCLDGDDILRSWSVQTMPVNAIGLVLKKLVQEKPSYKGRGGLTQKCVADSPVLHDAQSKCAARNLTSVRL